MENPFGFLNLSTERGLKIEFECADYGTCMIYKNEKTGEYELILIENAITWDCLTWYQYDHPKGGKEKGCILNYFLKLSSKPHIQNQYSFYIPLDELIQLREQVCPYSDECIHNSYSVKNFGNKKLKDFKSELCIEGEILNVRKTDALGCIESTRCIQIRCDNFLPDDRVSCIFYSKPSSKRKKILCL